MTPRIVRAESGMNIVGQGAPIMLLTAPVAAAAVLAQLRAPDLVRIPLPPSVLAPVGLALILSGLALWLTAVVQLLNGFPRGRLVTSGAYGLCRNPIYASMALLVLPGLSLWTGTFGYLAAGAVLCIAVRVLIPREEKDLLRVFGDEYRGYAERVHRLIPFVKPRRGAG
jgi:protein-S-isoprenylcysteine O-methyltransferase Ste14